MENLENVIESVLFVAGEPVLVSDLCFKFNVKPKEVEKAVFSPTKNKSFLSTKKSFLS